MTSKNLKSYWRELIAIIEGGLKPDPYSVSSYAVRLAQRLDDDGEARLSQRIRKLTDRASKPAGSTFSQQGLPADVESRQFLVEQTRPIGPPQYPMLPDSTALEILRFVELNRRFGELASLGLEAPSTLLLFGPPGCGKTMTATAIACDLDLPMFTVRLDSLLGSFLGNSAKNLRSVFDSAFKQPCVLLLDEFDVLGKMRDDAQEVGEVKRLVGTLLQNLDRAKDGQLLIAATNHHHTLDIAVWRRFDVTLQLDVPGKAERSRIISSQIPDGCWSNTEIEAVAAVSDGLSGSELTSVIERAFQDEFLHPDVPLLQHVARGALSRLNNYDAPLIGTGSKKPLISSLFEQFGTQLTAGQIAKLVGCSVSYVHAIAKTK